MKVVLNARYLEPSKVKRSQSLIKKLTTHNLLYAAVLMKGDVVIRHIPRKIAGACSLFLDKENTRVIVNSTGVHLRTFDLCRL